MYLGNIFFRLTPFIFLANVCGSQKFDESLKIEKRPQKYPLQVHQMYKDQILKKIPKILGEWSEWSPWSPCSRSCGGGITQQTRHCVHRSADSRFIRRQRRRRQNGKYLGNGCVGLYKRIHLCNNQECPNGRDFRYEQCASFNNRLFRGNRYQWEPFFKAKDECALNCRAIGMNFFATLNKTVIDGTLCLYPITHTGKAAPKGTRGICIDGFCKVVNSHGVIGSLDEHQEECSACLKGSCRSVSGIYTRPDLPPGYSLVAQIPAGACRILVQQLKHTRNFMALKDINGSYIVNGDWKLSNSRVYKGAGTKFVYIRQDENSLETLTSPGPLAVAVDIMIVNYQSNPGIKYGYSLPIIADLAPPLMKRPNIIEPTVLETKQIDSLAFNTSLTQRDEARPPIPIPVIRRPRLRRKHFTWKLTGLTACSKSCGGGLQSYVRSCVRDFGHSQAPAPDRRCSHIHSPLPAPIACNTDPCPPSWEFHWSQCSVSCGEGVQKYTPQCKRDSVVVNEALCLKPKPTAPTRPCKGDFCDNTSDNELPRSFNGNSEDKYDWETGPWSSCSVTCGTGHRTRSVTCPSGRCSSEDRPTHVEYCEMESCTARETAYHSSASRSISTWLLSDWSQCSEACGTGIQTRTAVCGLQEKDACPTETKPELSRACSSEKQCNAQWFSGPWGPCSDACSGTAKQKREVVCVVKIRGAPHIVNDITCPSHLKPHEEQACDGTCPPRWYFGDWRQCEGTCPIGIQRREIRCLDPYGRNVEGCPENDKPVGKRTCPCESDSKGRYKPVQDEPIDRYCVDKIHKCKLAVQARLCHYPYYVTNCCESCRRAQEQSK
ncbi:thrombospondin type-1 domain-containing protein 4 isoform X2 [Diorhabda sublineata]|uniref:thrombospondin type-1 domain-containing protein 4 isoform X2 n=1 Tax=Diorhabda sublineata TaxID=1163346 RepID=UPI0024E12BA0|nr:thrombospondin type-1 domain-containing protein 4 isoform X2 [Diorhabda sublineata]